MNKNEEEVQIASPMPVILSGLVNGGLMCLVLYLAFKNEIEPSQGQVFALNISFLLSTVVIAQIFFRRSIATEITFVKLWVAGWAATLLYALVLSIFFRKFFTAIGEVAPSFSQVLFSYSFFGLVLSAVVAFFISRKK